MSTPVALTSLAHGAGCGCKLPAAALLPIVRGLPGIDDPRVIVGAGTADDAAVFRISGDQALVLTIDFFTPIVDDPFDFGRIAAANALSDVYAMGGTPVVAMNVVAFPLEALGGDVLREILRGGAETAGRAGIAIVGGHSIDDAEPKYGLSVTGLVHPDEVISNAGGRVGDLLVLTKPLGVGAIVTARKRGVIDDELLGRAVDVMTSLNDAAAAAARAAGVRGMTDVTGFGLLGHLHSLGLASGVAARIHAGSVPAIDGVLDLLEGDDAVSGGSARNREYAETFTEWSAGLAESRRRLVCDATTSGGLLVAVAADRADGIPGTVVGQLVDGRPGAIHVTD
ncbi:MAG TPA: selenide, water dikinase SelD [Solirubrobacteraceae bacterium]|jgi:selenide,water dikinase|nr:selenide, water dikinase SelD [Solirubrobacteraceae bacterium]